MVPLYDVNYTNYKRINKYSDIDTKFPRSSRKNIGYKADMFNTPGITVGPGWMAGLASAEIDILYVWMVEMGWMC